MVRKRRSWPEIGEYVVATISRVEPHGAYAILEEYENREGLIHISEVAASWVRNIRNFVRERQKVVAKVLNVNPRKGHIDLSLRRVSKNTKKQKIKQWKRSQKAENLLELSVKKYNEVYNTSKTLDDAYNEIGWKMEDIFGDILSGFEEAKQRGQNILTKKGISTKWASIIAEIAQNYVEIPQVKITGIIEIQCYQSDGIIQIQKALESGIKAIPKNGTKININLIGSPKYRIEVITNNYKKAEAIIEKVSKKIINTINKNNGTAKFYRK
ncbi:MAG: translation initiation factor IF-2 subunit alpha [Candidatus Helarchaeota archaeon]